MAIVRFYQLGLILIAATMVSGCGKSAQERAAEDTVIQKRAAAAAQAQLDVDRAKLLAIGRGEGVTRVEAGDQPPPMNAKPGNGSAFTAQAPEKATLVRVACSGQYYQINGQPWGPSDALVKVEFDEAGAEMTYVGDGIPLQALERVSIDADRARGWFGGKLKGKHVFLDRGAAHVELAWDDGVIVYRGKCEKGDAKF